MLSVIVLIPSFLLSQWIFFPRANDSSPRLFLSKLRGQNNLLWTFVGKEISHLWTLHICNLSSWPLHKTQNFLCSHKTLDTTILISSDGIRMFFSFHNKNHLVMSCIYIFSYKSSLEDISPTSIRYYSKISMYQCHYDSKGILSWDSIKFLTITYPFLYIKTFDTSRA